jgi:hypothetical protein
MVTSRSPALEQLRQIVVQCMKYTCCYELLFGCNILGPHV